MERELAAQDAEGRDPNEDSIPGPGLLPFPRLAEAHRRAGRPQEAERIAREGLGTTPDLVAGRVALGLALLDQNRTDEARREFEQVVAGAARPASAPPSEPAWEAPAEADTDELRDEELDEALAVAEPEEDQILDADRIAQEALRRVEREAAESLRTVSGSPLATRTMADLLERQGDHAGAAAIRAQLGAEAGPEAEPGAPRRLGRKRLIARLEHWLDNLKARGA